MSEMFDRAVEAVERVYRTNPTTADIVRAVMETMRQPGASAFVEAMWVPTSGEIVGQDVAEQVWQATLDSVIPT